MRIRTHRVIAQARQQWIGTLALFLVLTGGVAHAANTVFSADIVDGEVKTADLGATAVTEAKLAGGAVANGKLKNDAVTSPKVLNETLVGGDVKDNALKGADIDESTLSNIGGGGPAGGDLTGTYPNPLIAPDAVGDGEVIDGSLTTDDVASNTLTGTDIDETSLVGVPIGVETGGSAGCNPNNSTFVSCGSAATFTPADPAGGQGPSVLALASVSWYSNDNLGSAGICRLHVDTGPGFTDTDDTLMGETESTTDDGHLAHTTLSAEISGPAAESVAVVCNETENDIVFAGTDIHVIGDLIEPG